MDRAAYDGMSAIENRHWWFVARRQIMRQVIREVLPPDPDSIELPSFRRVLSKMHHKLYNLQK